MSHLSTYRAEFPILSRSVYMISNSLGAMPRRRRGVARRLRRDMGDPRRARLGGAVVGRWARGRQRDRPHHRRARRFGEHARERHDRARGGAVVSARAGTPAAHRVLRGAISRRRSICCAHRQALGFELTIVPAGGGLHRRHRAKSRRHRRDDGTRRVLARPLPDVLHRGCRAPIIERAHGRRRAGDARHVSVRGHHPGRRHRARRGLRNRRMPEVAVRRAGQRVPLHASRPAANACGRGSRAGSRTASRSRSTSSVRAARRCDDG